jgi:hypothetical protein
MTEPVVVLADPVLAAMDRDISALEAQLAPGGKFLPFYYIVDDEDPAAITDLDKAVKAIEEHEGRQAGRRDTAAPVLHSSIGVTDRGTSGPTRGAPDSPVEVALVNRHSVHFKKSSISVLVITIVQPGLIADDRRPDTTGSLARLDADAVKEARDRRCTAETVMAA